ncbi:MAG: C40 family peptidase [Lachnospiraceae bacterium]|nr:C40 family peptidase [Lachnospiraceae bacterium]
MAKKKRTICFREDIAEGAARDAPEEIRLPSEKGYTRTRKKSRFQGNAAYSRKLRFGKKAPEKPKASRNRAASAALSARIHAAAASENRDDNVGGKALNRGSEAAEDAGRAVNSLAGRVQYARKLKASKNAEKLQPDGVYAARMENPVKEAGQAGQAAGAHSGNANFYSRWRQKHDIKQQYTSARKFGTGTGNAASQIFHSVSGKSSEAGTVSKGLQDIGANIQKFIVEHPGMLLTCGILGLIFLLIISSVFSCSMIGAGTGNGILSGTYTAEDADIRGANGDYQAMEADLQTEIDRVRTTHPGYDEYQFDLANINHNPYVLTSYLTVLYEDYTREEVRDKLRELFDAQYELTYREEVQIRTRTEERTGQRTVVIDPQTGETATEEYTYEVEVQYEYRILHVKLVNNTLEACIDQSSLSEVQKERFLLLNQTRGNREYLFAGDVYANPSAGEYTDYDIPTEALSDAKFAKMMQEAQKYLGYPYVWGGSSPSTSFDCSGFVCWVINHCGNGWNVGRTTAEGLRQQLSIIPASEAKPGDIIFFQGTYDTPGASHVGIYVGNGMMIHCGNPIQYASVNSSYFRQHFYCYGRLN